ncbi:MAG: SDR family oxidoreductase [SAR202 cluster bacterium]|jgi:NAD(P)-dependent dehydrogenase (short-subunit alcohol dehydrogenase family)|nr:SDR family oxidoreductase [SAR202 cluster bacterium]MQG83396.1 SDR family oxidoreductase [SAR202 cluster bacterium]HIN72296.1 SDR family oxidoreductase [Dehalococcoidia bacterium]
MGDLLKDKVGIVTGSGRGIGRGVAMLMAAEGAKMVVNDLGGAVDGSGNSSSPADDVVDEIKAAGGDAVANYDSVSSMEGGENIVKTAIDNFGKLDIVVTPAGILRDRMVFNMTEQEWDDVIAVHLKGTFTVTKFACILFRQQRSGNIITFSSTSGLYGNSGQANYGAAKDGIAGYTRAIARDMGRYGVRVNSISPGANSRMTATVPQSARDIRASSGISGAARQQPKLELRREPEDIAPFVTWLASDKADGVNGQVFHVTGGEVSLMNNPEVARTITTQGRWSVDEIGAMFPGTLGLDLVNPAPRQAPRE